jgi:hypothetical protein
LQLASNHINISFVRLNQLKAEDERNERGEKAKRSEENQEEQEKNAIKTRKNE